jgi:hypothetical protein
MFDNLKRMKAWIPIDGTYDLGPGPRMPKSYVPSIGIHAFIRFKLSNILERSTCKSRITGTPVVWDMNCLEEVCGACSMVINGRARQSCSAIVDQLGYV